MSNATRRLGLLGALFAVACQDSTAPRTAADLDVAFPNVPATPVAIALATGATSDDGTPPSDMPAEFTKPVTIRNYWTRASVSDRYASAEAYMEYFANQAKQSLSLIVAADGRQIATVPPMISAASWWIPIYGSLRTFSGIQVATECGITDAAVTVHEAKNEWQVPGRSPFTASHEVESSEGLGGQPMCPEMPPKSPTLDDGAPGGDGDGGGGGGGGDDGGSGGYYLSCWYALTYVNNVLTDVDQISCTIIS